MRWIAAIVVALTACSTPPAPMVRVTPTPLAIPMPPPTVAAARIGDGSSWTKLTVTGESPGAREGATLIAADAGSLMLFGGRRKGLPLDDLWRFDAGRASWSLAPVSGPKPSARALHAVAFDSKRKQLIVFGGLAGSSALNDLWAYSPLLGTWRQLGRASVGPSARGGACAAYDPIADRLFVAAGNTAATRYDDLWAYDFATDSWDDLSPPAARPPRRTGAACAVRGDGQFVLTGGLADRPLADFWLFQPVQRRWTSATASTPARSAFAWAFDTKRFLLVGGRAESGPLADGWVVMVDAGESRPIAPAGVSPSPRTGAAAAFDASKYYLYGGMAAGEIDDFWVLDTK